MAVRIQVRRGTAAQWAALNPVLALGEPAYETDTGIEKIGDGSKAWASLPEKPGRKWAATPTASASSDTGELLSILNAASLVGGDQVNLRRASISQPYLLNAQVDVPNLCSIVGPGPEAAIVKLTTAGSRLKFSDGAGGASGGFSVHGGTDAARLATVGVEVGLANQRRFSDIVVLYTTDDAFLLNASQNCLLQNVACYHNDGNGIAFDNGAASNVAVNCGGACNLGYALRFRQLGSTAGLAESSFNVVQGGVFERPSNSQQTIGALGLVYASAGYNNHLRDVTLGGGGIAAWIAINLTGTATLSVTDPIFVGNTDDMTDATFAHAHDTAVLHFNGYIAPVGALYGIRCASGARVFVEGRYDPIAVTNPLDIALAGYVKCDSYPIPAAAAFFPSAFIDEADNKLKFRDNTAVVRDLY